MTTLNKAASEISHAFDIHACTDVTGFSFLGHLSEMLNDDITALIDSISIPVITGALRCADEFFLTAAAQRNRNHVGDKVWQHELDKKMEEDEMTGVRSSVEKIVQLLNPANLATLVLHGISALLVGIIQVVILGIGVVIVKLLVILGPFVFAVSMLPVFQKQLSIWFGTLCSACMVFTVINILNQIMWQTFKAIYTESADMVDAATQQIQYLGMDLALIGAYCSCFWLSSKIVGHSDAGKIISKTVSIVTTAATIALMGGAAAGGKLTNVGGAASIGASFINDNNKK